jgi:very-short-patch-repair endonuclease
MPKSADIRAVAEFVASRHGVCTRSEASANGISNDAIERMVRDGIVVTEGRFVIRFTSHPVTWKQTAYIATLRGKAAASHHTAGALHGLEGCDPEPDQLSLVISHSSRSDHCDVTAVRTRDLADKDVTFLEGIRCTTIVRTICDLAGDAEVSTDDLIRMIDDFQRRRHSLRWLLQTARRLRRRGRKGPARVIEIVERRLTGYRVPESWFERLLERSLKSPVLAGVERQYVLRDGEGNFIARFDLAIPRLRLAIEGHSRSHHLGEHAEKYDEDRDLRASAEGWDIAYLGFAATKAPSAVCATIERIAMRRMLDLGIEP